ncbi:Predicted permease [Anaerobranca californiensis DSM 14826]|uniref:Predicted permease n=1 Tax=Anaerobranca californiensis DSM 14826 TaxID=1120989 RepID=A0A1M6QV14_9FIRM|nr:permease [Anaerobranca californiensis]SHK24025.1 Predicted permease [Anaerobranca californiensis DSM 14826]
MYDLLIYLLAISLLAFSFIKDRDKTKKALIKGKNSILNILPELVGVIIIIGVILSVLNPQTISLLLGEQSGFLGLLGAATIGAITLIPGFIAFPLAAMLLENGADYLPIAGFVSTLMMVGIATLPLEIKYFNKKLALLRNSLAFVFSFIIAYIIKLVVSGL